MTSDARKEYGDIIDREHYVDRNHPQMSRLNRAAQFSPFAALTGYDDLIDEAARQTSNLVELDDSEKEEISRRLNYLLHAEDKQVATITYFVRDTKKLGGSYRTELGVVTGFDEFSRNIGINNGLEIPLDDVSAIQADCFDNN